jgi:hypothetical protein
LTGLSVLHARGVAIAAVLVNQSPQGSVGLGQTMASLTSQWPGAPIIGVPHMTGVETWSQISAALGVEPPAI